MFHKRMEKLTVPSRQNVRERNFKERLLTQGKAITEYASLPSITPAKGILIYIYIYIYILYIGILSVAGQEPFSCRSGTFLGCLQTPHNYQQTTMRCCKTLLNCRKTTLNCCQTSTSCYRTPLSCRLNPQSCWKTPMRCQQTS